MIENNEVASEFSNSLAKLNNGKINKSHEIRTCSRLLIQINMIKSHIYLVSVVGCDYESSAASAGAGGRHVSARARACRERA